MKLYFVRHPQTSWNKKHLFQGSKEGSVTKQGKQKTAKFLERIQGMNLDKLYYADNKRCEFLAKEVAKLFPKILIKRDARINERSFGEYEGKPESTIAQMTNFDPNNFEARYVWKARDGESYKDISNRLKDFLGDVKSTNKEDSNVFIITSGGVMKVVLYILALKTLSEALQTKYKNLDILETTI